MKAKSRKGKFESMKPDLEVFQFDQKGDISKILSIDFNLTKTFKK